MITVSWPPASLGGNSRAHHINRWRDGKKMRREAWAAMLEAGYKATKLDSIAIHVRFYPPTKHAYDDDNLLMRFKPVRDGIADALQIDDNKFRVSHETCASEGKPGRIEIDMVEV